MAFRYHLLATSAVLAAVLGTSAHAQTETSDDSVSTIEELVVTAEKRGQSLQDVPVAVTAFTSKKRDLLGVATVGDLTNFTPGLEYNAQLDRNTLRGVGRNSNVHAAEGSVAQYSDGVFTTSTTEAGKTPLFVDRIEVLRGPQGTLYGRNSIGGAINIISKRPTEDLYAEVRAQYQNYNMSVLEGVVSGPTMIPGVQFRFGANWTKQTEGWFENVVPGQADEGGMVDTKYVEGQLRMRFNDNFDGWVKLAFQDWHNDSGGPGSRNSYTPFAYPNYQPQSTGLVPVPGYACQPNAAITNIVTAGGMSLAQACTNPALSDPRKFAADAPNKVKLTPYTVFASEFTYHFDEMDVKYIGGGSHYHLDLTGPGLGVDHAPITAYTLPRVLPPGTLGATQTTTLVIPGGGPTIRPRSRVNYEEKETWYSHELNLASTHNGPLQWIGGLYYYHEEYDQPVSLVLMDMPRNFGVNLSDAVCPFTGGVCPPLPGNNLAYDNRPHLEISSKAVFGQIDWEFAEQFKATLGLRYTEDRKKGHESLRLVCVDLPVCGVAPELLGQNFYLELTQLPSVVSGLIPGLPGAPGVTPGVSSLTTINPATGFATRRYKDDWSATTGTAGLQWDFEPGAMAYARYSRGYKAGGFRIGIDTAIGPSPATGPEHADAIEVGLKKDFGRRLQTNIAAFYYKYTDAQIPLTRASTTSGLAAVDSIFYNIPESISQGIELESIWQPIDDLQILFNYSYLDAHVTKGSGVVDPADPAALAPGAKPIGAAVACSNPLDPACDIFTGFFQRGQNLKGGDLPNAPKNKIAVNVNYTWRFEPGSLSGSVNYIWRDKQYGSIFNRSYYRSPSYDQWDARLTWNDADNKYTVIAFIKNVLDDIGYGGGATATRHAGFVPGYALGQTGALGGTPIPVVQGVATTYPITPPRTYGVELQYRFF